MQSVEKVTLSLPKELMRTVREMAPRRGQSKFVAEAIEHYVAERQRQALRERLIEGYQANAAVDAALAAEWQAVEDEAWLKYAPPSERHWQSLQSNDDCGALDDGKSGPFRCQCRGQVA